MPSIYAHEKFGMKVFNRLSEYERAVVRRYPSAYHIGLQGPDFLFFYRAFCINKINQKGVFYHHQDNYIFMKRAVKVIKQYGTDSPQYSYLLGFVCHFALDSACHGYVAQAMQQTGCGHAEIEGDFDRLLLCRDGFIPHKYKLAKLVPTDYKTAESMQPFYPELHTETIRRCLKWTKLVKQFFYAPGIVKRTLIDLLLRATFHYKKLNGHIVMPKENKKCRTASEHLCELLENAVSEGVSYIEKLNRTFLGEPLAEEFHKDFYGNSMRAFSQK